MLTPHAAGSFELTYRNPRKTMIKVMAAGCASPSANAAREFLDQLVDERRP